MLGPREETVWVKEVTEVEKATKTALGVGVMTINTE